MKCPFCGELKDRVVDSRESRDGHAVRRRRECLSCNRRFTSYEEIEDIPYMVVKNDGSREDFDRKKLLGGLQRACQKRPIAVTELQAILEAVEQKLHEQEDREISTRTIGRLIMRRLKKLDQVAYVRFASVYRKFEDVDAFMEELQKLVNRD
ncbi:MAG: transcriptional repressor NrdR [Acidobacteria bacterium]|nr:transcriptional repressor NrdR [Acidobacteriota bacterium]